MPHSDILEPVAWTRYSADFRIKSRSTRHLCEPDTPEVTLCGVAVPDPDRGFEYTTDDPLHMACKRCRAAAEKLDREEDEEIFEALVCEKAATKFDNKHHNNRVLKNLEDLENEPHEEFGDREITLS